MKVQRYAIYGENMTTTTCNVGKWVLYDEYKKLSDMNKFNTYLVCYTGTDGTYKKDFCTDSGIKDYLRDLSEIGVTNLEVFGLVQQRLDKKVTTTYSLPDKA